MSAQPRILIAEDDKTMRSLLTKVFAQENYEVCVASDGPTAIDLARREAFDVILTDLKIPLRDGLEVLRAVKKSRPTTEVIVMTAFGSVETAVTAMKQGAYDYLSKPFPIEEVLLLTQKALEKGGLRREVERLRRQVERREAVPILGNSAAMQRVFDLIHSVAPSHSTVLITGRSGTGKELVARAIHDQSRRPDGRFVVIHCGAIPDALVESELFGYKKGAFTGAMADHAGLFEEAHHGTVFLDEINTLTGATQAKLLRVLEEKTIRHLGGRGQVPLDVRLIAASNQDLEREVRRGAFREDLFYRLNVVHIHLPELKERPEDIPLLADHFLRRFAAENRRSVPGISRQALDLLCGHSWPGNVRELRNTIEQAVLLARGDELKVEDFVGLAGGWQRQLSRGLAAASASLAAMEQRYIEEVLLQTGGHCGRTAQLLGIDRRTLYSKMRKYGLSKDPHTSDA